MGNIVLISTHAQQRFRARVRNIQDAHRVLSALYRQSQPATTQDITDFGASVEANTTYRIATFKTLQGDSIPVMLVTALQGKRGLPVVITVKIRRE